MISNATVHKATVLMNRRMNAERGVSTFGPVCSSVAGMALHHPEGMHAMQEATAWLEYRKRPRPLQKTRRPNRTNITAAVNECAARFAGVVIWSALINPAMDCARDEQIIGRN